MPHMCYNVCIFIIHANNKDTVIIQIFYTLKKTEWIVNIYIYIYIYIYLFIDYVSCIFYWVCTVIGALVVHCFGPHIFICVRTGTLYVSRCRVQVHRG